MAQIRERATRGHHTVWSSGYFTLQNDPAVPYVRVRMLPRWMGARLMGGRATNKSVTPSHFAETKANPRRSCMVLRAWSIWRMKQNAFAEGHPTRRHVLNLEVRIAFGKPGGIAAASSPVGPSFMLNPMVGGRGAGGRVLPQEGSVTCRTILWRRGGGGGSSTGTLAPCPKNLLSRSSRPPHHGTGFPHSMEDVRSAEPLWLIPFHRLTLHFCLSFWVVESHLKVVETWWALCKPLLTGPASSRGRRKVPAVSLP